MTIDPQGPLCGCGNRGCLETFLGGFYMVRWARREMKRLDRKITSDLTPYELFLMAKRGDSLALRAWKRAGTALGRALSNLINVMNPDTILLCGGVAGAASLFLKHTLPVIHRSCFKTSRQSVRIRVSTNNRHLGVVGAALLVQ